MSKFTTEEKVRIVLDGMQYPEGITGFCRQVGISRSTYYHWQRTLLEKGKEGLVSRGNGEIDPQRALEGLAGSWAFPGQPISAGKGRIGRGDLRA